MRRDTPRIGVEVLLLTMILAVLGAGLALIVHAQSRVVRKPPATVPTLAAAENNAEPPPAVELPAPLPLDLTPERLRPIEALIAIEKSRASDQTRRAVQRLEAANQALDEARQSRIDEIQARTEVAADQTFALQAEDRRDQYALERDILAEKRDDARATLERQRLRSRDGVAVLPYKGPNGTWRRPIAIECRNNKATLQPGGPSYSMEDMSSFPNPRRSPLVHAVAKAMIRARSTRTPDGAASVPYLMFIVRPDGVRPYYAARTLLEPLGITYGYELADADWDIEFPDLDDPSEWTEIPGPKPALTWPPPARDETVPGVGLASKGSREGTGVGTAAVANAGRSTAGVANAGAGTIGASNRTPETGSGRSGSPDRPGQLAVVNPIGAFNGAAGSGPGDHPLASPGDGRGQVGSAAGAAPWGRSGRGSGDPFDLGELERLGSGDAGLKPMPSDGRVPWHPGQAPAPTFPSFQPTPPSDHGAAGSALAAGTPRVPARGMPSTLGGMAGGLGSSPSTMSGSSGLAIANESGAASGGSPPLTTTAAPAAQPSGVAGSETYREAIARRHGLVAPIGPGSSGRSNPAGGQAGASPGGANSASASGGSPGGGGGSSGGAPGGQGGGVRDPFASQSFPLVVSCDRSGLTIHPSGETIAFDVLSRDDAILPAKLRTLVKSKQDAEPEVGLRPRVNFLVKPGGEVTYLKARWQTTTATSYPTTWQLVNRGGPRLPDMETR